MQQVKVFIETSSRFRGNVERKCGYVLSTQLRTGKETREHFGRVTGTYHQAILLTMVDALDHMTRKSAILIKFTVRFSDATSTKTMYINPLYREVAPYMRNDA